MLFLDFNQTLWSGTKLNVTVLNMCDNLKYKLCFKKVLKINFD